MHQPSSHRYYSRNIKDTNRHPPVPPLPGEEGSPAQDSLSKFCSTKAAPTDEPLPVGDSELLVADTKRYMRKADYHTYKRMHHRCLPEMQSNQSEALWCRLSRPLNTWHSRCKFQHGGIIGDFEPCYASVDGPGSWVRGKEGIGALMLKPKGIYLVRRGAFRPSPRLAGVRGCSFFVPNISAL